MPTGSAYGQEKDASYHYVQCGEGVKWYEVDAPAGALTPKGELATIRCVWWRD